MSFDWYVCGYIDGKMKVRGDYAVSREEADNQVKLNRLVQKGYTWKVMHRKELTK